jgi:hypothetical protein
MKELQDRLSDTENKLVQERSQSAQFWDVLNGKQGQELEAAQKDLTIMFLKTQTGIVFFHIWRFVFVVHFFLK